MGRSADPVPVNNTSENSPASLHRGTPASQRSDYFSQSWAKCSLRPLAVANAFFNGRYAEQNGRSYLVDC